MELPITSLLAGAAAIFLVLLSLPVALRRRATKTSFGDGGDEAFNRKIRAQANFIEYAPMAIIAIGLVEMGGGSQPVVCGLAATLAAARVLHAFGLWSGILIGRALGAMLTFGVLLVAGVMLIQAQLG
ncbi:MAG: MAPEG family protein [Caulobacter sp.]